MHNVYFDEAGNTGFDLMNVDQPVFVLAANIFSEERAKDLITELRIQNGAEAKFKTLRKSVAGRKKIIDFIGKVSSQADFVKSLIIHKRYMALGKILDILVEPVYFEKGLNFNANAHNISTTNMLWYLIPCFYGEAALNQILEKFVQMIKTKSKVDISGFYQTVRFIKSNPLNLNNVVDFTDILESERLVNESLEIVTTSHLDPVQCGLFTQTVLWGNHFKSEFAVIHDESNSLAASLDDFNRYTDPSSIQMTIGSDFRSFNLPLLSTSVSLEDSKSSYQIQVSDLIAGSLAYFAKAMTYEQADPFADALKSADIEKLITHPVWPELKVNPEQHGITKLESHSQTSNPADQITAYLFRNKKISLD